MSDHYFNNKDKSIPLEIREINDISNEISNESGQNAKQKSPNSNSKHSIQNLNISDENLCPQADYSINPVIRESIPNMPNENSINSDFKERPISPGDPTSFHKLPSDSSISHKKSLKLLDHSGSHNNSQHNNEAYRDKKSSGSLVIPEHLENECNNSVNNYFENKKVTRKKHLEKKDLYNREKSKLACLIRKKYTTLMKESIKLKGTKEKYVCCSSFRKVTSKVIYQLTGTIVQAVISILAIIVYVVSTYYPDYSQINALAEPDKTVVSVLKWSELGLAIIINIDFLYNVITSKQRMKYLCNFLNILDIVIVLSVYLNFIIPDIKSLSFIRIFRVIRVMRVFRFYKIIESRKKEYQEETKSEITRRLISAILTVLAVVFLATGVVHFLNGNFPDYFRIVIPSLDTLQCQSGNNFTVNSMQPYREGMNITIKCEEGDVLVKKSGELTFDLAFYYMVITMATVGYGDIYPDTSWMRLVIGIFVIISIITITKQTSELNDLIKLNSEYQVPFEEHKGNKHCVLSGFFSKSSLIKFLNEFYHADHKEHSENTKIVIIQSDYPDKEIQTILMNPKFEENLHYLIGDIFSENTLQMAKVQTASGIFLISDQNHPDVMKNDQFLILACKAISQYSQAHLYVQFNFSQSLLHDWADWDIACSSQQIKMSIIVKNGFISGFSTMIMNLASSSSSIYNSDIQEIPWMLEYIHGASQEIYIVKIPEDYTKEMNFAKFAESSYIYYGSLVIGMKKKVYYQEDKDIFYFIYLLNPVDYEMQREDEIIVISSDATSAKNVFSESMRMKVKKKNPGDGQPDGERSLKAGNIDLVNLFKDESEAVKDKAGIFLEEEEERSKNISINNVTRSKSDKNVILGGSNKQISNYLKVKIPEIFHKRQHFKIWENNPDELSREMKNHYLIFCKEENLWEFMNCFEQYYSEVIFFVSDQHPSPKWDILRRYFKNLVYIECSYSDQEDLTKLNLERAKHAFILTYAVENSNVSDSGILPLVKIIEENFPKCKYTLELSDELNVRYLNNKGMDQEGRVFNDNNENDANENGLGINQEEANIKKKKKNKKVARLPVRLWPKYAKSDIFFASSLESLLAFSYHNEGVLDVLTKILGFNHNVIRDKHVSENDALTMYRYVGSKKLNYEKIVTNFFALTPPVIPIAVYRMNNDRELKNESHYIITNPKKDLELNQFDKVICIGRPQEKIFEAFRPEDYLEEDSDLSVNASDKDKESVNSEKDNKKKHFNSSYFPKRSVVTEDLDNMDEEQLLEKLVNEIRILKHLTCNNQTGANTFSGELKTVAKLFNPKMRSTFNVIEEKIDETDEIRHTFSEQNEEDEGSAASESSNDNDQEIMSKSNNRPKFRSSDVGGNSKSNSNFNKEDNKGKPKFNQDANIAFNNSNKRNIKNKNSSYFESSSLDDNSLVNTGNNKEKIEAKDSNSNSNSNSNSKSYSDSDSESSYEKSESYSSNSKDKKKRSTKQIINNNNYSIKIRSNNKFQGNNTINISKPPAFAKLAMAAVEGFNIVIDK